MFLQNLSIINFKNYNEANLEFSPKVNCFTGKNASGKTNLLDAIYYLSFCKSFSNPIDSQNIHHDFDFFVIRGNYKMNGKTDELHCGMKRNQNKIFKRNKKVYDRLSDHIGLYPLVLVHPGDVNLLLGGSEDRRKFVDGVISQYNKEYLHVLLHYKRALLQRNTLLKSFAEKKFFDESSLEVWDEQLIEHGSYLYEQRKLFFDEFLPVFSEYYSFLTHAEENVSINYISHLNDDSFENLLKDSRQSDTYAQFTTKGIHKDNLEFIINNYPVKKFGSQGQQKSFIIALKLAQFAFTKRVKELNPIMLFDDIFDKLDEHRVTQLMKLVSENTFGQIFVTDTDAGRLEKIFSAIKTETKIFEVDNGMVKEIKG
ncbi:MAG: DNA replication/repair protein RecF [Bacteroidota bacterium]